MPVLDTEVLFGLNPKDRRHKAALAKLKDLREKSKKIMAPDAAVSEFQIVLRGRGMRGAVVRTTMLALHGALQLNGVEEIKTIDSSLLAAQSGIEEMYRLSYFDSLMAASALSLDGEIVSDDQIFDLIREIKRTNLTLGARSHL